MLSNRIFIRKLSSINVAIVGSGPAGFYTAQKLLKNPQVKVDIFEKLPVPFGLVRYGVAPDHADVKNVINSFTKTANENRVQFLGNISVGKDINIEHLLECYDALVLAYGSSKDKFLGIDGESDTRNTISARNFVGWYNGLPEDKDLDINLDCDTACIIGQGNVALDCARILLRPETMSRTDITSYSHQALLRRKIRRLFIIGRRGPIQASFTAKELKQMVNLEPTCMNIDPSDILKNYNLDTSSKISQLNLIRPKKRLLDIFLDIQNYSSTRLAVPKIDCTFKFFSKPVKIQRKSDDNPAVGKLFIEKTTFSDLDSFLDPNAKPLDTGVIEEIDCGLIIRSIGYKATLIDPKLPYNHKLGAISNTNGRIDGFKNLYCAGWLATGASGVIAGTLNSSQITAQSILDDIKDKKVGSKSEPEILLKHLEGNGIKIVRFNDWLKVDELEQKIGEVMGKSREKLVDVDSILDVMSKKE